MVVFRPARKRKKANAALPKRCVRTGAADALQKP